MRYILFLIISIFCFHSLWAQNISVASFKVLPTDLDARVNFPVKDQNGDVCALIKVVTTESGFSWDGDQLGIVKVERKVSEYWLYVPFGAKKLTINHANLGQLRDYRYPLAIEKAVVYEMKVLSGQEKKTVIPVNPTWVTMRSNPEGADVYINDVLRGKTPLPIKLMPGKYTYRLEKPLYRRDAGNFEVSGQEKDGKKDVLSDLKPAFGTIKINTSPEQGATVLIDDIETDKTTPFIGERIKSGTHIITVKKDQFQPKSIEINVKDGETTEETITLISTAVNLTIETQPVADIFIDGKFVSNGKYQGKIQAGLTTFEAKKESYYTDKKDIEVRQGEPLNLILTVQPKQGNVNILSNPIDAKVFLNGQDKGITPLTLQKLLIGSYELKIEKKGYTSSIKNITVEEDKTIEINETLVGDKKVTAKAQVEEKRNEKAKDQDFIKDQPKTQILPDKQIDTPKYSADYYKYKKGKTTWLISAIVSAGVGTYSYLQSGTYYDQYQTATTDAESIFNKAKLFNSISPVAFAVAGLCTVEFILKSGKQSKAKKQTIGFNVVPTPDGAFFGLAYRF
ncbi:MAG: PEGA domain-containing protein [Prolixibacteraceae bacterium]